MIVLQYMKSGIWCDDRNIYCMVTAVQQFLYVAVCCIYCESCFAVNFSEIVIKKKYRCDFHTVYGSWNTVR